MNGLTHVLAVALIVTQLSGCSLLDLLFGFDEPFEPGEPFPTPTTEARYTTGSATLTIDGETILLDELVGEAVVDGFMGLSVRWTNGDGWFLGVSSIADMGPVAESTFLAIDWIADNRHWTISDPSRCDTTIERASGSGLEGSATCTDLEWLDYFSNFSSTGFPEPIPGEEPFDAEITFEAH